MCLVQWPQEVVNASTEHDTFDTYMLIIPAFSYQKMLPSEADAQHWNRVEEGNFEAPKRVTQVFT